MLFRQKHAKLLILSLLFLFIFILMSILRPKEFLSVGNLQSMASQMPEFGLISLAMMIVILTGGIDLSIVNTAALSSIVGALFMRYGTSAGMNPMLTIAIGLLFVVMTSIACGMLNGVMIGYLKLSPILVTLGTMSLIRGVALNVTRGGAISGFSKEFAWFGSGSIFGIPVPMVIYIVAIIAFYLVLQKTPFGTYVYMVGSNRTAVTFSGVNVKKVLLKVSICAAVLGGLASILIMSRYNSAKVDYGSSYLMKSIAAVVLGGTAISGGVGNVFGTVIAVAILQIISTGLNQLGVNGHLADIVVGCILITVLGINYAMEQMNHKKKVREMSKVIGRIG